MPALSQNGWEANNRSLIATAQVPSAGFGFAIRRGPATTVLVYVLTRFHNEVEHLIPGQCWGYAERPIRGSSATSNHASGTAVDANSLRHPLGAVGTFTPEQVDKIHEILRACRGLVRWGGDYRGRRDEMHLELIGNEAQIAGLAAQLTQPGSRLPDIPDPIDPPEDDMPFTPDDIRNLVNEALVASGVVENAAEARRVAGEALKAAQEAGYAAGQARDLGFEIRRAANGANENSAEARRMAGVLIEKGEAQA